MVGLDTVGMVVEVGLNMEMRDLLLGFMGGGSG